MTTTITKEQAEAIAKAPWSYASADITAALRWAVSEIDRLSEPAGTPAEDAKPKLITVGFVIPADDPAYDHRHFVGEIQAMLYDENGMSGSFRILSVDDYDGDPLTFMDPPA